MHVTLQRNVCGSKLPSLVGFIYLHSPYSRVAERNVIYQFYSFINEEKWPNPKAVSLILWCCS